MRKLALLFLFMACCRLAMAGVPALERELNLAFNNEPLSSVLNKIQEQAGLVFSYSSSLINNAPAVSLQLRHKTVREALAMVLPNNIAYKARNNYIILKEKPLEKKPSKTELSGYVYDKTTEKKIANVTLYDKNTLQTVTTNEYGYYSITLPKEDQCLTVNKENYRDTCVSLTYLKDSALTNISIDPLDESQLKRDSLLWRERLRDFSASVNGLFKRFKGYVNTMNVKDTFTRSFQVSLLPFAGTNGLMSGNVYNHFSFNIFGGYARGVKGTELGGAFNIDREDVSGIQAAGIFNVVGDSVKGVQLGGGFNVTGKYMSGIQAAGIVNLNLGSTSGLQLAGSININAKQFTGFAVAGSLNISKNVKGMQVAGLANLVADTLQGFNAAGFMNLCKYGKASGQLAGIFNRARYGQKNVQLSGLFNKTGAGVTRLQVGPINSAKNLSGLQLGVINFADTASGVPVGLFSFVKKGMHQLELSGDETFFANLTLRTGVNKFYNIPGAGIGVYAGKPIWHFGYGIGTSILIKNKVRLDATAGAYHVSNGGFYFGTSELYKFYLGVEYKFSKKFSLAAGPTFNLYWADQLLPDYTSIYSSFMPYTSFNKQLPNDFNMKGWFGARLALRFF